jgi:hypothetical protein
MVKIGNDEKPIYGLVQKGGWSGTNSLVGITMLNSFIPALSADK